jgi:uncharacterized protein YjbI with pentapeptide repeats
MDFLLVKPLGISSSFRIFREIDDFGFVNSLDISRLSTTQTGSGKCETNSSRCKNIKTLCCLADNKFCFGQPGNAGRADALQDLSQDGIPLDGISLTGGANLIGPINLSNASMTHADFSDGNYEKVNFPGATLDFSKWNNTYSINCNFQNASFWATTFSHSTFVWCDFSNALFQTQFTSDPSEFRICNFANAAFLPNWFNSVRFVACNFAYADMAYVSVGVNGYTNTSDILWCCNLYGATASPDFIKFTSHQLVTFTNIVSLEKWKHSVTNGVVMRYERGGPEFMNWASNAFSIYNKTNNPQAWLNWRSANLEN